MIQKWGLPSKSNQKKLNLPCKEDALLNESQESYHLERKDFELKAQSPGIALENQHR
jgi:hypothetical protein